MSAFIPYGRQDVSEQDIQAVVEVLRSDWLTQGPAVPRFEQTVVDCCGVSHAVATNSATSALHLACLALGLREGDSLWTSPNTFVASANCALYCGASVDFVDIDPRTYNMSVAALEAKLQAAERTGNLPQVVVPVHFAGQSCEMAGIRELAERYDFRILEDAAHAIGGRYRDEPVGSCRYSDIAVFSFHPVKIVTSGEGGMAVTNDEQLAERMRLLRSHGITRDTATMTHVPDGAWYYQQIELGYNYRMTDIQAALGASQMMRIDQFVARRHLLAERYQQLLAGLPVSLPAQHPDTHSAMHLYPIRLFGRETSVGRREIFETLRASGIGVNVHYIPVHTQPYFQRMLGFKVGDFPEAERYYAEAISLPMHSLLTDRQQDRVVDVLARALAR